MSHKWTADVDRNNNRKYNELISIQGHFASDKMQQSSLPAQKFESHIPDKKTK